VGSLTSRKPSPLSDSLHGAVVPTVVDRCLYLFMGPGMFESCSQELAAGPYSERVQSRPEPHTVSLKSVVIFFHPHPVLRSGLFPSGFPTEILNTFIILLCPIHFILLDFIALMLFDEVNRL